MKRLQNRISESGLTLPIMSAYGLVVWLMAGLLTHWWWPQLLCFVLTAYMMVELNNTYSLLRVRSRMVSATFIALSCTMTFLFGSLSGGLSQLFFVASLLLLLSTYQSAQSLGRLFYAFLLLGLSSLLSAPVLIVVPVVMVLTAMQLQSMSWRGISAAIIGLLTPYWCLMPWLFYSRDLSPLTAHMHTLTTIAPLPEAYAALTPGQWTVFALVAALAATGAAHFRRQNMEEKIRTRLFYGFFSWMTTVTLLLTALQPQLYDPMMRLAVVCASPLVAHFLTLSNTRATNIAFFVIVAATLAVTAFQLLTLNS